MRILAMQGSSFQVYFDRPDRVTGMWSMVVEETPYFETVGVDPPKRPRS